MKTRSTLILTLLLPAVLAAGAAAQVAPIRVSAPVNPIAGMPALLPSPLDGRIALGISFPTLLPNVIPASLPGAAAGLPLSAPAKSSARPLRLPAKSAVLPLLLPSVDEDAAPMLVLQAAPARSARAQARAAARYSREELSTAFDGAAAAH
jgi:hypothetical protein